MHEELAKTVVKDALSIDSTDVVTITTWDHTIDVANAFAVECFRQGADAIITLWTDEYFYGLLEQLSEASLGERSKICEMFTETETAAITMFGPKNPEGLKSVSPSKLNAWNKGERESHYPRNIERGIRNVSLPLALLTPERSKVYGFKMENWRKTMSNALAVDLKRIASTGREIAKILEEARKVHLTATNGTDLTFELNRRPVHIDDGIIDKEDIAKKSFDSQLPAGTALTTIVENSSNGEVNFDLPLQSMGVNIEGLEWKFKDGKLTAMKARKNLKSITEQFQKASGDKDRISFLQIGLNPQAEYGYLIDHIVEGSVQLGVGDNEYLGGKNTSSFGMAATLSKATLEIDGRTVIQKGKLLLK